MANATVTLGPPAYVVREKAHLGLPTPAEAVYAAAGGLLGAGVAAIVILAMPSPAAKWLGAALDVVAGGLFAAASPLGTIPQEMGVGALALAGGWMWFDLLGALQGQPSVAAPAWLMEGGVPHGQ
jgi:hypothetical protein